MEYLRAADPFGIELNSSSLALTCFPESKLRALAGRAWNYAARAIPNIAFLSSRRGIGRGNSLQTHKHVELAEARTIYYRPLELREIEVLLRPAPMLIFNLPPFASRFAISSMV